MKPYFTAGHGMQFADGVFGQGYTGLDHSFYVVHRFFDVGDLQQLVGTFRFAFDLAVDVLRQRSLVALDPCRSQALRRMKQPFELEENVRWGVDLQSEPAQKLELALHVDQTGVE